MLPTQTRLLARLGELQARAPRRRRAGMTLFEVMIVIVIILLIMGALAFGVQGMFEDAKGATAEIQMAKINERVQIYVARKRKTPATLQDAFNGEEPPLDPWGNDFVYRAGGKNGKKFELVSYGADGKEGGTGADADIKWSEVGGM